MKIQCQTRGLGKTKTIKVKIVRAPLVDSRQLRQVIFARARALVL